MSSLLLAPHNDDEVLFASFTILRHHPHVIVCLFDGPQRENESRRAVEDCLGTTFEQWSFPQWTTDWAMMLKTITVLHDAYGHVFAPQPNWEKNGNDRDRPQRVGVFDHDYIGQFALDVWGREHVTLYQTYTRWGGRCTDGLEVVPEPGWVAVKLRGLACYESQHDSQATSSWFLEGSLREWVAP